MEDMPYNSDPPEHLAGQYGSYHQLYRIDGELVALGVIDILPNCVSSVYFMYDTKWERFSLGKVCSLFFRRGIWFLTSFYEFQLSALREAALVKEIHAAGVSDMQYLYMGKRKQTTII